MNLKRKGNLARIVSMLTLMALKFENISEQEATYSSSYDHEPDHDHEPEHDYDYDNEHEHWLSTDLK